MQRALLALTTVALVGVVGCTIGTPIDQRHPGKTGGPGGPGGEGEGVGGGEGEGSGAATLDVAHSTLSSDPATSQPADGIAAFSLIAHVVDTNGQPMSGLVVHFAASLGTLQNTSGVTNASGDATVALSSSSPGDATITANIDSAQLAPLTVSFEGCRTIQQAFEQELYPKVFSRCQGCHNEMGLARVNGVWQLPFPGVDNWADRGVQALTPEAFAQAAEDDGSSLALLVAKPTERLPTGCTDPNDHSCTHGGGQVVAQGSEEDRLLQAFAARLVSPDSCTGVDDPADVVLSHVVLASPRDTYARAKLALTGQVATPEELAAMPDTEAALDTQLDALMQQPEFITRVTDWYADWFLTDQWTKQMGGSKILNRNAQFTRKFFFTAEGTGNQQCDPTKDDCCSEFFSASECTTATNDALINALAREPLDLLTDIVKNDQPISNAVTSDHTRINPLEAVFYGFTDTERSNLFGTTDIADTSLVANAKLHRTTLNKLGGGTLSTAQYPHAGVVTTQSMLARWPTTTSNKNRGRARSIVMARLMDIDVMKFAEFSTATLPPDADLETATQQYIACTACHSAMDPIAGLFKHYSANGVYTVTAVATNTQDMPTPSFLDQEPAQGEDPLQFLIGQVSQHERFPLAMLLPALTGLTGFSELEQNVDSSDPNSDAKILATAIQHHVLSDLRAKFVADNMVLRPFIKEIIKSEIFRAASLDSSTSLTDIEKQALQLAGIGRGVMITPEQLDRKLASIFGFDYHQNRSPTGDQLLLDVNQYRILFGGINYNAISTRFRDPSPVLARIVERMSAEMSCTAVPQEFATTDATQRKLFTLIEDTDTSDANVRAQIKRLHSLLLDENVNDGDTELEATVQLFKDVQSQGAGLIAAGTATTTLPTDCKALKSFDASLTPYPTTGKVAVSNDPNYIIRAWMAVVSYLLQDPRFFTE